MSDQPTYEVKIKDTLDTPVTPTPPSMSDEQISALVDSTAQAKAEAIATSKVEKLKEELAESLAGKKSSRYGDNGPESWDKLHENITSEATEKAVKAAEERIESRLKAEKEERENKEKMTQKQLEEQQKAEYARMSADWQEAVQDGVLPDISPTVREKLKSGVAYEDLSDVEKKDPGLRAYNEARLLHVQLKQEGKSNSFYRTVTQFYRRQPAGSTAPVFGGSVSSPGAPTGDAYDYDEVAKNRRDKFGF